MAEAAVAVAGLIFPVGSALWTATTTLYSKWIQYQQSEPAVKNILSTLRGADTFLTKVSTVLTSISDTLPDDSEELLNEIKLAATHAQEYHNAIAERMNQFDPNELSMRKKIALELEKGSIKGLQEDMERFLQQAERLLMVLQIESQEEYYTKVQGQLRLLRGYIKRSNTRLAQRSSKASASMDDLGRSANILFNDLKGSSISVAYTYQSAIVDQQALVNNVGEMIIPRIKELLEESNTEARRNQDNISDGINHLRKSAISTEKAVESMEWTLQRYSRREPATPRVSCSHSSPKDYSLDFLQSRQAMQGIQSSMAAANKQIQHLSGFIEAFTAMQPWLKGQEKEFTLQDWYKEQREPLDD